jgi:hypothetical protein
MKAINNFDIIAPILSFSDNSVYEISIINNDCIVKTYMINSFFKFYELEKEMIKIAEATDSEVIIMPQPYNLNDLWFSIMNNLLAQKKQGVFEFENLASQIHKNYAYPLDRWVVDIEYAKLNSTLDIDQIKFILTNKCNSNILLELSEVNRKKLLIENFNIHQFIPYQDVYYKCTIKKDIPLLLYYARKKDNN